MKISTTVSYHLIPMRMDFIKMITASITTHMWRKAVLTWGCILAHLVQAAGWRRFLKALKMTCPVIQQPHGKPVSQKGNYTPMSTTALFITSNTKEKV